MRGEGGVRSRPVASRPVKVIPYATTARHIVEYDGFCAIGFLLRVQKDNLYVRRVTQAETTRNAHEPLVTRMQHDSEALSKGSLSCPITPRPHGRARVE